jgi:alkanesulfonate monooxygenase SsuD/methylene tetrahydromethanopterin reductase-like flavin-dependent oxidoreductase (luciferase family)
VVALHINPLPRARELVSLYKEARWESSHQADPSISLLLPLFVGTREEEVKWVMEPAVQQFIHLVTSSLSANTARWGPQAEQQNMQLLLERFKGTTYETMNEGMTVFGTSGACAERLQQMSNELGVGRIICWFNLAGAVPPTHIMACMELFAQAIMPHFAQ